MIKLPCCAMSAKILPLELLRMLFHRVCRALISPPTMGRILRCVSILRSLRKACAVMLVHCLRQ